MKIVVLTGPIQDRVRKSCRGKIVKMDCHLGNINQMVSLICLIQIAYPNINLGVRASIDKCLPDDCSDNMRKWVFLE